MSSDRSDASTFTPALLGLVWTAMFGFSAFFFSYSTMVSIAAVHGLSAVTGGSVLTTMMIGVIAVQPFAPWVGRVLGLKGALFFALGLQLAGQILGLVVPIPLLGLVLAGVCGEWASASSSFLPMPQCRPPPPGAHRQGAGDLRRDHVLSRRSRGTLAVAGRHGSGVDIPDGRMCLSPPRGADCCEVPARSRTQGE